MNVEIDNDAANKVLEVLWSAALLKHLEYAAPTDLDCCSWTKLSEGEAAKWVCSILSGAQEMRVHYLEESNRYTPDLRGV